MHPSEKTTELEKLTISGAIPAAKREGNFLHRAHRFFLLWEDINKSYDRDRKRSAELHKKEKEAVAGWGIGGFIAGALGVGFAVLSLLTASSGIVMAGIMAGVAGLLGGVISGLITDAIAKSGANSRAELREEIAEHRYKLINHELQQEISGMERGLMSQPPEVRSEFREAFKHAAMKDDLRAQREHRKKIEAEAEETREAAEMASTMATVAAVNSIMAASRSR